MARVNCYLCETPGAQGATADDGNRQRVTCRSGSCGQYVETQRAIRRLVEGGPNKVVLVEMVQRANARSRVLDISVADDGLVQTTELAPAD